MFQGNEIVCRACCVCVMCVIFDVTFWALRFLLFPFHSSYSSFTHYYIGFIIHLQLFKLIFHDYVPSFLSSPFVLTLVRAEEL